MITSDKKKLLELTYAEWEGIGTWYEYLAKYKIFKKLKDIKTVLIAGLPQEYGVSADMLLFTKSAKVVVIDDRKEKLEEFLQIAKKLEYVDKKNLKIFHVKNLAKYPFQDNIFDLVSNTEVIQRITDYKEIIKEMERVSKKHVILFIPNAYYYAHYIITKIKTFKIKEIIKSCNLPIVKKDYLDRPPWPAGVAVSASGISFSKGSKAKDREKFEKEGVKENFIISFIKKIFIFLTPLLVSLEFLYPTPLKQILSHMFYIHMIKK